MLFSLRSVRGHERRLWYHYTVDLSLPNRSIVCKGLRERSASIGRNVFYFNVLRTYLCTSLVE